MPEEEAGVSQGSEGTPGETHLSLKNPKRREPVKMPDMNTVCPFSLYGSLPHTRSNCRLDKGTDHSLHTDPETELGPEGNS